MFANFNWPSNLNLAKFLEKDFEKPVFLDNDVNVITLGEMYKGLSRIWNVLGIAIGTGIGAGIVINKKLFLEKMEADWRVWTFNCWEKWKIMWMW